jgi:hypothetical protein
MESRSVPGVLPVIPWDDGGGDGWWRRSTRWVLSVRPIFICILIASALLGCGPDPTKQALLEQLVTTRSTITAGVTQMALRDREIALRTAAKLADDHLNVSQREAVGDAILAISEARTGWSNLSPGLMEMSRTLEDSGDAFGAHKLIADAVTPLLDTCATRLDAAIASLR